MSRNKTILSGGVLNSLFLLTLLMLGYMAAIGFGTVWLRHEISISANVNKTTGREIADLQRRLAEVTAEVAKAEGPEQLRMQNVALGLNLVAPREEQIIRTADDVERKLAAKRFDRLFSAAEREVRPSAGDN